MNYKAFFRLPFFDGNGSLVLLNSFSMYFLLICLLATDWLSACNMYSDYSDLVITPDLLSNLITAISPTEYIQVLLNGFVMDSIYHFL